MSDTTARDQLADLIEWAETDYATRPTTVPRADATAAAILAAGWRPPARTVSTVEELGALADGAYVKDANCWTWIICQSLDPSNEQDPTAYPWAYGLGVNGPTSLVALPAEVLWETEGE